MEFEMGTYKRGFNLNVSGVFLILKGLEHDKNFVRGD
jgi:hypothetical protein